MQKSKNSSNSCQPPVDVIKDVNKQNEEQELKENLEQIKHKIIVLSGKGGVGKSTVAVNLAVSLANKGHSVGLLDIDIHGPSIPKLLGIEDIKLNSNENQKLIPADYSDNLKVISIGFLIENTNDPVVWRGPLKYGVIKQFLKDVLWGELDYLIVDSPPGTGDEPLSICQLIGDAAGAVVVTTPQDVALIDVKKSINFCHQVNMPVIGVVENMSGFTCPNCNTKLNIFKSGGGKTMSEEMGVHFLGEIPLDAAVVDSGDNGQPISASSIDNSFKIIIDEIIKEQNKK